MVSGAKLIHDAIASKRHLTGRGVVLDLCVRDDVDGPRGWCLGIVGPLQELKDPFRRLRGIVIDDRGLSLGVCLLVDEPPVYAVGYEETDSRLDLPAVQEAGFPIQEVLGLLPGHASASGHPPPPQQRPRP